MFIKQIDKKTALELAARGKEVLVMYPVGTESVGWRNYEHETLGHMLEGCMFFRREPAMELDVSNIIKAGEESNGAIDSGTNERD